MVVEILYLLQRPLLRLSSILVLSCLEGNGLCCISYFDVRTESHFCVSYLFFAGSPVSFATCRKKEHDSIPKKMTLIRQTIASLITINFYRFTATPFRFVCLRLERDGAFNWRMMSQKVFEESAIYC